MLRRDDGFTHRAIAESREEEDDWVEVALCLCGWVLGVEEDVDLEGDQACELTNEHRQCLQCGRDCE